ncbi:hypothetical protein SAMN05421847_2397 [Halpernia humi]|uniref:Uncharacterized protein n=1 Tax=Halpernia humi TaxID=493375 RepID=A0A1H6AF23_9FLAO|nr:DUF6157 family protein [Halpernia humi]SEG47091.1 hypothetical protein SAMN05421847_2397 [Halpernia humi]
MKVHTTDYKNTFIQVAEDCPVSIAEIPTLKRNKTLANIQYEIISENPYKFTSDEIMLHCYILKNNIPKEEREQAKKDFFSKGQPCFRSSALAKRYGFGFHFNADKKVAIYPRESADYQDFEADETLIKVKAMRSKRAK